MRRTSSYVVLSALIIVGLLGVCGRGFAQAGKWQFTGRSADGRPCRAVIPATSPETVSTRLLRNDADRMVLIVGNPTWDLSGRSEPLEVRLQIDDGPFEVLAGWPVGPLVLHVIEDRDLERRVRDAHSLTWRLPWGVFRAPVSGVGAAYDGIGYCVG